MLRRTLTITLLLLPLVGCTKSMVQNNNRQPPDPLLLSKKPVEGKPTAFTRGNPTDRLDPQPPPYPGSEYSAINASSTRLSSEIGERP